MTYPPIETPFRFHEDHVRTEWIDHNGHMNAWEYQTLFRHSMFKLFDSLGLGANYNDVTGNGVFLLDYRIQFLREAMLDARLVFDTRVLDVSDKIIHYFIEMRVGDEAYLAATCESLEIVVNLKTRKPTVMSPDLQNYLREVLTAHRQLPTPPSVGSHIGIRR